MPQPCLDILSMSRFSTDAVSDTYTCRDLDNMTTAVRRAAAFIKQHTFCSSIMSANFEGGGVKTCAGNADTGGGVQNLGKLADIILEDSLTPALFPINAATQPEHKKHRKPNNLAEFLTMTKKSQN